MSAVLHHPRLETSQPHHGFQHSIHGHTVKTSFRKHQKSRTQLQLNAVSAAALDQQQVALNLPQPPDDYDYKSEILPETLDVVQQQYPQLLPLVEAGNLVVYRRTASYKERRTDGYQEPKLIFVLGTAHVSQQSADDVTLLTQVVQPDAVVVELCKSRTGILHSSHSTMVQQQQQLPQHQQRWRSQWQQWQVRREARNNVQSSSSSSDVTTSIKEDLEQAGDIHAAAPSNGYPCSSNSSSTDDIGSSQQGVDCSSRSGDPSSNHNGSDSSGRQSSTSSSGSGGSGVWSWLSAFQAGKASNPLSLSGADPVTALARSASLGGQQALLLRLLLASQAAKAADQLGVRPGAEFCAAAEAAAAVEGGHCCLVLGDRPIEITLSRAWAALTWRRRLQLLGDLLQSTQLLTAQQEAVLSQQQVEALRSDDAISVLFSALSARYPELVAPLIAERDLYLTWSLKRSKAVNGASAVVGVVGKGHLRGIVYALKHDQHTLRFRDLVGGKNSKQSRREAAAAAVRRLVVELVLGVAAYAAWQAVTSSADVL